MLRLTDSFVLGSYRRIFGLRVGQSPQENLMELASRLMKRRFVDGVLAMGFDLEKKIPKPVVLRQGEMDGSFFKLFFIHGGQNSVIKKAIQGMRLERLAVFGQSCVLDGVNKLQYFGIGCNFAGARIALKIGIACVGALSCEGMRLLLLEKGAEDKVLRNELSKDGVKFYINDGKQVIVPFENYYDYINEGCKACMNLSSRGSDFTVIPTLINGSLPIIVRSVRGERVLLNSFSPSELANLDYKEINFITDTLRCILLKNADTILKRAMFGVPSNKWDGNRYGRFSYLWNNVEIDDKVFEEEVF